MPDERYEYLCDMWKPPSQYPAYLHITDIAGLVKGASEGAGLGNNFLSHIQAVDGIFHVVRAFDSEDVGTGRRTDNARLASSPTRCTGARLCSCAVIHYSQVHTSIHTIKSSPLTGPYKEVIHVDDSVDPCRDLAGGLLRTSTRPTLNLLLLLRSSV